MHKAIDEGYQIGRVCDYDKMGDKYILLRHDVDFNLDFAYDMAMVDADMDISSTFYILLQSPTYNVLSPNNMEILRLIEAYDHEIGWQIDTRTQLALEYKMLEAILNVKVKSFAQHDSVLTGKSINNNYDMINAKDVERLRVKYISESSMNWREGCMCNWIGKLDRLEILTHPIWWVNNCKTRWEAIDKLYDQLVFDDMFSANEYRERLRVHARELGIEKDEEESIQSAKLLEESGQDVLSGFSTQRYISESGNKTTRIY